MARFLVVSVCCIISFFPAVQSKVLAAEVLVVTWRGKTDAEKGFEARLKELRPDVTFKYIDANRNKTRLKVLLESTDLSGVDLVYSFGTTGSKTVRNFLRGRIPQVFNIVTAPVKSKLANSMTSPGNNLTGAKLGIEIELQLQFLLKLKKIKSLGVWYDPREKQGEILLDKIWKFSDENGIKVVPRRIIPDARKKQFVGMFKEALAEAKGLDALYLTATSSFASIRKKNFFKFLDPGLLVMSGVGATVGQGATIALTADYRERGEAVAELAHKILSGVSAGHIPVSKLTMKSAYLYIDRARASSAKLSKIDNFGLNIVNR